MRYFKFVSPPRVLMAGSEHGLTRCHSIYADKTQGQAQGHELLRVSRCALCAPGRG